MPPAETRAVPLPALPSAAQSGRRSSRALESRGGSPRAAPSSSPALRGMSPRGSPASGLGPVASDQLGRPRSQPRTAQSHHYYIRNAWGGKASAGVSHPGESRRARPSLPLGPICVPPSSALTPDPQRGFLSGGSRGLGGREVPRSHIKLSSPPHPPPAPHTWLAGPFPMCIPRADWRVCSINPALIPHHTGEEVIKSLRARLPVCAGERRGRREAGGADGSP